MLSVSSTGNREKPKKKIEVLTEECKLYEGINNLSDIQHKGRKKAFQKCRQKRNKRYANSGSHIASIQENIFLPQVYTKLHHKIFGVHDGTNLSF